MKLFINIRTLFSVLLLIGLVVGLQACSGGGGGGGGSSTPAVTVNTSLASAARGYYEGGVELNNAAGNLTISSRDFKAIVDEKEFVVIYKGSQILLYKGTFTEVTTTTFKADIRVYLTGNFIATAEITNGTINAGVLKGTIVGTGAYVNTDYASSAVDMELTYNNANSLTPPNYAFGTGNEWQDATPTGAVVFDSNTVATYAFSINNVPSDLTCAVSTFNIINVVNEQTGRLRKFLTEVLSSCGGSAALEGTKISGYLTNYNGGGTQDDRMLVVVSDDNYAYVGILPCGDLNGNGTTCLAP